MVRVRHGMDLVQRRVVVVAATLLTLLALVAPASAQTPHDDSGAVDEYVEDIPTSGGSTPVGGSGSKKNDLPADVATQVETQGGDDSQVLEDLATLSAYGAPQQTISERKAKNSKESSDDDGATHADDVEPTPADDAVAAAGTVTTGGSRATLFLLLAALFVVSAVAIGAAVARRARSRT